LLGCYTDFTIAGMGTVRQVLQPGYFMDHLLRPRIWPSFLASSGVRPCDVPFRYASEPPPCGCPVAHPSS
ncbi:MAG: hypothetical protein OEV22_09920, partial [Deltaproteobacteria bacterium]|nr:hypothetical protein [Deltaproteobacteria bacterium]